MNYLRGIIVDMTYSIEEGTPYIYIFGRNQDGKSFFLKDKFLPYFFVEEDIDNYEGIRKIEKTDFRTPEDKSVKKIITNEPKDVAIIRKKLAKEEIDTYEADILFTYRYILDYNIKADVDIEGEYHKSKNYNLEFEKNPKIKSTEILDNNLKILSIDLECLMDEKANNKDILCIGLAWEENSEVHIQHPNLKNSDNTYVYSNERELLLAVAERIVEIDPDIITGWNVVNFDLKHIAKRCKKLGIDFKCGRIERNMKVDSARTWFQSAKAKIVGRKALDAMQLCRDYYISLDDYTLSTASKTILDEDKFDFEMVDLKKIWEKNPDKLIEYNKQDAILPLKIMKKKKLLDLTLAMNRITGLALDDVRTATRAFDMFYLPRARARKIVCPSKKGGERKRLEGGLVQESKIGRYFYVATLDFLSLYPSIMRTFNIDPILKSEDGEIEAPNEVKFKKSPRGILPSFIDDLLEERIKIKKRLKKDKGSDTDDQLQNAIKLNLNSMFGVLGNPGCRFFDPEVAGAITAFGRHISKTIVKFSEKIGYKVIYGDTDSIFSLLNCDNLDEAVDESKKLCDRLNKMLNEWITKEYRVENKILLELEKIYRSYYLPTLRGQKKGAKKRYAGLVAWEGKKIDEYLDIVGLEFVRGDWTQLAKDIQYKCLMYVLNNEEEKIEPYIKSLKKDLYAGKYDDKLIYQKQLRKPLQYYTKTTPPHVKAARKIKDKSSLIFNRKIKYIVTGKGPEPVEGNKKIYPDYTHYIRKQINPIINSIEDTLNPKKEDRQKQTSLMDYF